MNYPNFSEEKKLWKKGMKRVVGLDEAGRGPLAGPVIAGAVILRKPFCNRKQTAKLIRKVLRLGVKDSKKISEKKREKIYNILINHPYISWAIGRVSEKTIDRINILEATKLAMEKAVRNLEKKSLRADFLILDGRIKINLDIPQKSIIRADNQVFSCAAASIIAKVKRDRIMKRYDKKYPQYRFSKHKGYGTKLHFKMLRKHGPCPIHRKSFRPLRRV